MARRDRPLRERCPVFFAFESEPIRFRTLAESVAATPGERIRSVWPFLARTVLRFHETLRPREQANYDPEDILTELYCRLAEKDDQWDHARGAYITFAARVVGNELHKIRDRTRTVHSPGNSWCRLREYEAAEASGALSPQRAHTLDALRRSIGEAESIDPAEPTLRDDATAEHAVSGREEADRLRADIARAVMKLSSEEAVAIAGACGLFGSAERAPGGIARTHPTTAVAVRAAQERARAKLRDRLDARRDRPAPAPPEPQR